MKSYNLMFSPTYLFLEIYASSAIAWAHEDFNWDLVYMRDESLREEITSIAEIKTAQVNNMQQTSKDGGIKNFFRQNFSSLIIVSDQLNTKPASISRAEIWALFGKKEISNKFYPSINCSAECQRISSKSISPMYWEAQAQYSRCVSPRMSRGEGIHPLACWQQIDKFLPVQTGMWLVFFATSMHCLLMLVWNLIGPPGLSLPR